MGKKKEGLLREAEFLGLELLGSAAKRREGFLGKYRGCTNVKSPCQKKIGIARALFFVTQCKT